jgi:hypothetical protein
VGRSGSGAWLIRSYIDLILSPMGPSCPGQPLSVAILFPFLVDKFLTAYLCGVHRRPLHGLADRVSELQLRRPMGAAHSFVAVIPILQLRSARENRRLRRHEGSK